MADLHLVKKNGLDSQIQASRLIDADTIKASAELYLGQLAILILMSI